MLNKKLVRKFVRSLPKRFSPKTKAIEKVRWYEIRWNDGLSYDFWTQLKRKGSNNQLHLIVHIIIIENNRERKKKVKKKKRDNFWS